MVRNDKAVSEHLQINCFDLSKTIIIIKTLAALKFFIKSGHA